MDSIAKNYKQVANTWNNSLKLVDNIDTENYLWVVKNDKKISQYIDKTYDNINTRKTHFTALTAFCKYYMNNAKEANKKSQYKQIKKKYQMYSDISTALSKQSTENYKKQEKGDKFVEFENIEKIRDSLHDQWTSDLSNNKLNILHLLFAINTYNPPIRSNIYDIPIERTKLRGKADFKNYTYRDSDGLWHLRIFQTQKMRKNNYDHIIGQLIKHDKSKNISKLINESLDKFPRKYLLSSWTDKTKPLNTKTISAELKKYNVSIDIFRNSFVSNLYASNPSLLQKEQNAELMLHDIGIEELAYNKRDDNTHTSKHPPPPARPVNVEPYDNTERLNNLVKMLKEKYITQIEDMIHKMKTKTDELIKPTPKPPKAKNDTERIDRLKESQKKYKTANRDIIRKKQNEYVNSNADQKLRARIRAYVSKLNTGKMAGAAEKLSEYKIFKNNAGKYVSGLMMP